MLILFVPYILCANIHDNIIRLIEPNYAISESVEMPFDKVDNSDQIFTKLEEIHLSDKLIKLKNIIHSIGVKTALSRLADKCNIETNIKESVTNCLNFIIIFTKFLSLKYMESNKASDWFKTEAIYRNYFDIQLTRDYYSILLPYSIMAIKCLNRLLQVDQLMPQNEDISFGHSYITIALFKLILKFGVKKHLYTGQGGSHYQSIVKVKIEEEKHMQMMWWTNTWAQFLQFTSSVYFNTHGVPGGYIYNNGSQQINELIRTILKHHPYFSKVAELTIFDPMKDIVYIKNEFKLIYTRNRFKYIEILHPSRYDIGEYVDLSMDILCIHFGKNFYEGGLKIFRNHSNHLKYHESELSRLLNIDDIILNFKPMNTRNLLSGLKNLFFKKNEYIDKFPFLKHLNNKLIIDLELLLPPLYNRDDLCVNQSTTVNSPAFRVNVKFMSQILLKEKFLYELITNIFNSFFLILHEIDDLRLTSYFTHFINLIFTQVSYTFLYFSHVLSRQRDSNGIYKYHCTMIYKRFQYEFLIPVLYMIKSPFTRIIDYEDYELNSENLDEFSKIFLFIKTKYLFPTRYYILPYLSIDMVNVGISMSQIFYKEMVSENKHIFTEFLEGIMNNAIYSTDYIEYIEEVTNEEDAIDEPNSDWVSLGIFYSGVYKYGLNSGNERDVGYNKIYFPKQLNFLPEKYLPLYLLRRISSQVIPETTDFDFSLFNIYPIDIINNITNYPLILVPFFNHLDTRNYTCPIVEFVFSEIGTIISQSMMLTSDVVIHLINLIFGKITQFLKVFNYCSFNYLHDNGEQLTGIYFILYILNKEYKHSLINISSFIKIEYFPLLLESMSLHKYDSLSFNTFYFHFNKIIYSNVYDKIIKFNYIDNNMSEGMVTIYNYLKISYEASRRNETSVIDVLKEVIDQFINDVSLNNINDMLYAKLPIKNNFSHESDREMIIRLIRIIYTTFELFILNDNAKLCQDNIMSIAYTLGHSLSADKTYNSRHLEGIREYLEYIGANCLKNHILSMHILSTNSDPFTKTSLEFHRVINLTKSALAYLRSIPRNLSYNTFYIVKYLLSMITSLFYTPFHYCITSFDPNCDQLAIAINLDGLMDPLLQIYDVLGIEAFYSNSLHGLFAKIYLYSVGDYSEDNALSYYYVYKILELAK